MAKETRGGKYSGGKEKDVEPLDVEVVTFVEKGKTYYTLKYAGTDKRMKIKWRQTKSLKKYANKHHFNII